MTEYKSLIGGYFSSTPYDKSIPASIRCNNPGAINGASWERQMPGYVTEYETTAGNKTTVFSTPEYGAAAYYVVLQKYRAAGAKTVKDIIWKYGGGQANYVQYGREIARWTGMDENEEVPLVGNDAKLLAFSKAMFRYEAGKDIPWSDRQILCGFDLVRQPHGESPRPSAPSPKPSGDVGLRIKQYIQSRPDWKWFTGKNEVNIVYLEGTNPDFTLNDNAPNRFNDLRIVLNGEGTILGKWEATTNPSRHWVKNRMNEKGAANIKFGQYTAWRVGIHHNSHEALVQTGGPVTVYRDDNEDFKRDGDKEDTGYFGVNQHWGYDLPINDLGTSSAGCQVGRTKAGHLEFMKIVKSDPRYTADHAFVFTSTILDGREVLLSKAQPKLPKGTTETVGLSLSAALALYFQDHWVYIVGGTLAVAGLYYAYSYSKVLKDVVKSPNPNDSHSDDDGADKKDLDKPKEETSPSNPTPSAPDSKDDGNKQDNPS